MKKILFPTDFTKHSENAFRYALNIADHFGAEILTIHTYVIPTGVLTPPGMVLEISELAEEFQRDEYEAFIEKLDDIKAEEGLMNVVVNHRLEAGVPVNEVAKISKEEDFDFIIMSTTGAEGLGKWFFGSHAANIVQQTTCPTLIIPKEAKYKSIDKIAFTTNFEDFGEEMGQDLIDWMVKFEAELFFVHVNTPGETIDLEQYDNMKELKDAAKAFDKVTFKIIADADVLDTLEDFVEDEKIDMMVMVTHDYPFYQRIFKPSVTKQMTFETEVPLLVYHAKK